MFTAIVRYRLPATISYEACRDHFHSIAPGFQTAAGLLSKHFICAPDGETAGGVYQWESREAAEAFYSGPWLKGIVERYGMEPEISFFDVFALTDNRVGEVQLF
jgi:hypothetical protein